MSNVAETSLHAYHRYAATLPEKRAMIFTHFLQHPDQTFTNYELYKAIGIIPSSISPKVLTLRKDGWLVHAETRPDRHTGNRAMAWMVNWKAVQTSDDGVNYLLMGDCAIQLGWVNRDKWKALDTVLTRKGYRYVKNGVWTR